MLGTPKRLHSSALIPFVPRQVMLLGIQSTTAAHEEKTVIEEKKKKKKKKKKKDKKRKQRSSEAIENGPSAAEALDLDLSNGGTLTQTGKGREALLDSIAGYLESNGFSRTLAVFRSEAQLPTEGGRSSALNLEDLFCKFLESSKTSEYTSIDWPKEQDSGKVSSRRTDEYENILDASEHAYSKKMKNRDGIDDETKAEIYKPGHESLKHSKIEGDETDFNKSASAGDLHVKVKDKKNKKKAVSDSLGDLHLEGSDGLENTDQESHLLKPHVNDKEERKKKHKMIVNPSDEKTERGDIVKFREMVEEKVQELKTLANSSSTPSAESNPKHKDEKKKKTKRSCDALVGNSEQLKLEASQKVTNNKSNLKSVACESNSGFKLSDSATNNVSIKSVLETMDSKSKDKKKKRGKASSERLVESDQADGGTSHDGKERCSVGKSDSGKEVTILSEENVDREKNSKKRKRLVSNGTAPQAENAVESKDSQHAKVEGAEDKSLPDNEFVTISKKRKKEKGNGYSMETVNTSSSDELNILNKLKANPVVCNSQKAAESPQLANGDHLQKEREGGTSSKEMKKEKHSAEPTANAFRRVKVEEINFIDQRLQDNSYWAKDGADSGYGAKAQEVLGQVKGRDFRHEKTKKKRGSYRGGLIDFQSHSVKFNYADEE